MVILKILGLKILKTQKFPGLDIWYNKKIFEENKIEKKKLKFKTVLIFKRLQKWTC